MRFEVELSGRIDVWALRAAGLITDPYWKMYMRVVDQKASTPCEVSCPYLFSEKPVSVRITLISTDSVMRLGVEVRDKAIGRKIRQKLVHYSVANDGEK